jgi:putative phosphoesterase
MIMSADGAAAELLVVSDTHGDVESLRRVLTWAKARSIRTLAFLGDGLSDLTRAFDRASFFPNCFAVRGNGDYDASVPFHRTLEVAGRRFLMTHGHLSAVQDTLDSLVFSARAANAEAALFGHTHVPCRAEIRGVLALNPGSLSRPRGGCEPSFATVLCPASGVGPLTACFWKIGADRRIREYGSVV